MVSTLGEDPASADYPGSTVVVVLLFYMALALGLGGYARLIPGRTVRRLATTGIVAAVLAGPMLLAVQRWVGPPSPVELRVLAGSELVDPKFRAILDDLREETGVTLDLDPIGTVAGSDQIVSGTRRDIDAAWFATDEYLELFGSPPNGVAKAKRVMRSPIVIGLKRSVARRLREKDVQKQIMDRTARRPVNPDVKLDARRFPSLPGETNCQKRPC